MQKVAVIILNYKVADYTVKAVESVLKSSYKNFEIIVVDNNSDDDSAQAAKNLGAIVIKNDSNLGFASANNQGMKIAKGKYILFLNSDTEINSTVLSQVVSWMNANPKVGVATCGLKNKNGSLQATGGFFPNLVSVFSWMIIQDLPFVDLVIKPFHPLHAKSPFVKGDAFYDKARQLDWVTGAFLLTRKQVVEKVKWDESFFMYVEEVDFCYRVKKLGWEVWYLPQWNIVHLGGASSKTNELSLISEYEGVKKFYVKHYASWQIPLLRLILKIGALGRIILFGILEGPDSAKIYAKAFRTI